MSKTKNFICALEDSGIHIRYDTNIFDELCNKFYQFGDFWNFYIKQRGKRTFQQGFCRNFVNKGNV